MMTDTSTSGSYSFKLGEHEGRLSAIESQLKDINAKQDEQNGKLDRVLSSVSTAKGSWKMLITVTAVIAGLVEAIHHVWEMFHK